MFYMVAAKAPLPAELFFARFRLFRSDKIYGIISRRCVNSFFNGNKYGFERNLSAPSALKIFEIHIVLLQIFALTERKSSPSKLLRI